jgi:glutamine synthetase
VLVDPGHLSEEERSARSIRRLPGTLWEALDNLEQDAVLTGALGPLLTRSFLAVKRQEWEAFSREDVAYEVKHHFWKF